MKNFIYPIVITGFLVSLSLIPLVAQNTFPASGAAGIGTLTPNASSILDISSTTSGVLVPRMTKAQRDAIVSPATGLLIYQTNSTPGFYFYSGSVWTAVSPKAANTNLSNLTAPTGVNVDLLPLNDNTLNFGSVVNSWKDGYWDGDIYIDGNRFISNSNSVSNAFIGAMAGNSTTSLYGDNAFVGYQSGYSNVANYNTALGSQSLFSNTVGQSNIALGYNALFGNISGNYNTSVGFKSMYSNTASFNSAFGYKSLYSNTTGINNIGIGYQSAYANTTGMDNIGLGTNALLSNTVGNSNIAIGSAALNANITGIENVAIGKNAGAVSTWDFNIFIGAHCGETNTSGVSNTFIGTSAGSLSVGGLENVAVGYNSLTRNTTGEYNVALGSNSLSFNTTGGYNIAVGSASLNYNSTGYLNVAVGDLSLSGNSSGYRNTAVGSSSLFNNSNGFENAAVGYVALYSNTTGTSNTAAGAYSLYSNTTGIGNTASGYKVNYSNTTGANNTAMGYQALYSATIANSNSVFGYQAGYFNVSGGANTLMGYKAGYNATSVDNSIFGYDAGSTFGNNSENSCFGSYAGHNLTGGNKNTFIGRLADESIAGGVVSNSSALGYNALVNNNNMVRIGNTSITSIGGQVGWTNFSDGRIKKDVQENVPGVEFINLLRPVTYHFDMKKENELLGSKDTTNWDGKFDIEKIQFSGFIAQEVNSAAEKIGYDFSGVDKSGTLMALRYSEFVVPLVKAVQELSAENDTLKSRLDAIESALNIQSNSKDQEETISQETVLLKGGAYLQQNVPNPFDGTTAIGYYVPDPNAKVQMQFISSVGELIYTVDISSGKGIVNVQTDALAPGIYQYILLVNGNVIGTKQMILQK